MPSNGPWIGADGRRWPPARNRPSVLRFCKTGTGRNRHQPEGGTLAKKGQPIKFQPGSGYGRCSYENKSKSKESKNEENSYENCSITSIQRHGVQAVRHSGIAGRHSADSGWKRLQISTCVAVVQWPVQKPGGQRRCASVVIGQNCKRAQGTTPGSQVAGRKLNHLICSWDYNWLAAQAAGFFPAKRPPCCFWKSLSFRTSCSSWLWHGTPPVRNSASQKWLASISKLVHSVRTSFRGNSVSPLKTGKVR